MIEVERRPVGALRLEPFVDPAVQPDEVAAGADRQPVEVDVRHVPNVARGVERRISGYTYVCWSRPDQPWLHLASDPRRVTVA